MRIPGRRAIGQYCYFLPRTHTSLSLLFKGQWIRVVDLVHLPPYHFIKNTKIATNLGCGSNLQWNRSSAIIGNVMRGGVFISWANELTKLSSSHPLC